jgi:hypothetical protein
MLETDAIVEMLENCKARTIAPNSRPPAADVTLPATVHGVPVRVEVVGEVKLLEAAPARGGRVLAKKNGMIYFANPARQICHKLYSCQPRTATHSCGWLGGCLQ